MRLTRVALSCTLSTMAAIDCGLTRMRDRHEEEHLDRLTQRCQEEKSCETWRTQTYSVIDGRFNRALLPAALPRGLRFLQLSWHYNQPLQQDSIPDTVEVLQLGYWFSPCCLATCTPRSRTSSCKEVRSAAAAGCAVCSLRQLCLSEWYTQLLQAGSLPARLQRLHLGEAYNHPLQPGVITASVTHLELSDISISRCCPAASHTASFTFVSAESSTSRCCQACCPAHCACSPSARSPTILYSLEACLMD